MEAKVFNVPSLAVALGGHSFSFEKGNSMAVLKLDKVFSGIFQELYQEGLVLSVKEHYQPIVGEKMFSILFKVFFTETKYFKIFFKFSLERKILGFSLNGYDTILSPFIPKEEIKALFMSEIRNGRFGIEIEKDYMRFLPLFKANNRCCLSFKNLTCDPVYDPIGVDFLIKFEQGPMRLQLKGARNYTDQQRVADKHFNLYPLIPLMFTFVGEKYSSRKKRLILLRNLFLSEAFPFVSFLK
ncbi:hypothetical protein KKA39_01690 [Patescibacteria group bacterium]|nr:hypothetical protein [Patescibacteria group bacterium]